MNSWKESGSDNFQQGRASGLVAGTSVATSVGWRPVETLIAGDKVLTFDDGLQKVTRIDRALLWPESAPCPQHLWPLDVPEGALGNQTRMMLLPEQAVMLESDIAEEVLGNPFSLMYASVLDGFRKISRCEPRGPIEVVNLCFADEQVIFANIGALFHCPRVICGEIRRDVMEMDQPDFYTPMDMEQADTLTALIEAEESREALI